MIQIISKFIGVKIELIWPSPRKLAWLASGTGLGSPAVIVPAA
jgi:hypothetical protein